MKRATDAKESTGVAQIQEEISLAWNGVQVDGITKGWTTSEKAGALQTELRKEDNIATATVNGNDIDVTYKEYGTTIKADGSMTQLALVGTGSGNNSNLKSLTIKLVDYASGNTVNNVTIQFDNTVITWMDFVDSSFSGENWSYGDARFSNVSYCGNTLFVGEQQVSFSDEIDTTLEYSSVGEWN